MTSTRTSMNTLAPGWWRRVAILLAALLIVSPAAFQPALAQDDEPEETPDVVIPGTGDDDEEEIDEGEATEEEGDGTSGIAVEEEDEPEPTAEPPAETVITTASPVTNATEAGFPAVLGHGLAFLSGERVVWQVRQVEPAAPATAAATTSNAAVVYQVTGSSVIRNEVTGKRALLSPGVAYFKSGGDAYTTSDHSGDSTVWVFEVVTPGAVASDAFYESPLIESYSEGVYDMRFTRYVLAAGESAPLPEHTGPALVVSIMGDIDIESGGLGLLGTGDGQLVSEPGEVFNNSLETVVYVVASFGEEVDNETARLGTAQQTTTTDETTTTTEETATTTDEGESVEPTATPSTDAGSSQFRASINITALEELYVVVVVDGITVFDGPIPSGQQSGVIVGSVFEVYTTHGAATMFTDACGHEYWMGFETGEARYHLAASANSCPPA